MSLISWFPFNGDLNNQGKVNLELHSSSNTYDGGKVTTNSIHFNGNQAYMTNPFIGLTAWTISFWYKANSPSTGSDIMTFSTDLARIEFSAASGASLTWYNSSTTYSNILNSGTTIASGLSDSTWYQITIVFNNGTTTVYLDGVQKVSQTGKTTFSSDGINRIYFGSRIDNTYANINLNDLRLYDHALSKKEIRCLSKGLCLHYSFNTTSYAPTANLDPFRLSAPTPQYASINEKAFIGGRNCQHYKCQISGASGWAGTYIGCNPTSQGFSAGTTVTRSCWMYVPSGQTSRTGWYFACSIEGNSTGKSFVQYDLNKCDTWQRVSMTGTLTDTTNNYLFYFLAVGSGSSDPIEWYMTDCQLEVGSKPTEFTVNAYKDSIPDLSGYAKNGIAYNVIPSNDIAVGTQSMYFNGTDAAIAIPSGVLGSDNKYSMSIWFKKDGIGSKGYETLIGGTSGYEIESRHSTETTLNISPHNWGGSTSASNRIPFNNLTWYNYTFVCDGTNTYHYLNGELKLTLSAISAIITYNNNPAWLGAWKTSTQQNFKGWIGDFKMFATPLTATDVLQVYQNKAVIDNIGNLYCNEIEKKWEGNVTLPTGTGVVKCGDIAQGLVEVEYIESTGTQYINIGVGFDRTDEVVFAHCLTDSSQDDAYLIAGSTWNSNNNRFGMGRYSNSTSGSYTAAFGASNTGSTGLTPSRTYDFNIIHTWTYKNNIFSIPELDTSINVSGITFGGTTTSLQLFKDHAGCRKGKIGYYSQKKNGVLVRELVPCFRASDGVVGMYDKVEGKLYLNSGTGEFKYGPIKNTVAKIAGYTRLEYIQNSSTQWINTGFKPNQDTHISMIVSNSTSRAYWFGAWNSAYNNGAFAVGNDGGNIYTGYDGQGGEYGSIVNNSMHRIEQNKNQTIIDDVVFRTLTYTSFSVNYNLYLFAQDRAGTASPSEYNGSFRLHQCKIYNNNKIVRDYVPVKRNSDNVLGLLDLLTNTFYTNAGSGSFTAGPEYNRIIECNNLYTNDGYNMRPYEDSDYLELEYIESTGSQYVNTGYTVGMNISEITIKAQQTTQSDTGCMVGAGTADSAGNGWGFYTFGNADYACLSPGVSWYEFGSSDTSVHTFKITLNDTSTVVLKDWTQIGNPSDGYWGNSNAWRNQPFLISKGSYTAGSNQFKGKIYFCKIENNGVLVRDYIPVMQKSTGKVGLYDKIENKFYASAGSTQFNQGPVALRNYDNVSATAASWHTVWSGSKAILKTTNGESTGTISISGLKYNLPTRITGSYSLYTGNTEVGSGAFTAEGINRTSSSYTTIINTAIPTATSKSVSYAFNVNSAGKLGYKSNASNLVGDASDGLSGKYTKIEQYY